MGVSAILELLTLGSKLFFTLYSDYKEAKRKDKEEEWHNRIQDTIRRVDDADDDGMAKDLNNFFNGDDADGDDSAAK